MDFADIGDLPYDATANITNVAGQYAWVEIEPGKWVCVQLGSDRYMKPV